MTSGGELLNNKIYQKRKLLLGYNNNNKNDQSNIRNVYYPLSKKRLLEFNIDKDLKINISKYEKI